jgi:hypothetical protein
VTATERPTRLSAPAILRVLDAAGVKSSRPHLDVEALARCIDVCVDLYEEAKLFRVQTIQKKERGQLKKVFLTASQLKELLVAASAAGFVSNHRQVVSDLSQLVEDTKRLLNLKWSSRPRTGLESDYVDKLRYLDHFKSKSPLQWMVGVYLAEVYEIFIGAGPVRSYLRFAYQVLKELRIKNGNSYYSRESIARAARGYSRRRKLAPRINQDEWTNYRSLRFSWACRIHENLDLSNELERREKDKAKKMG